MPYRRGLARTDDAAREGWRPFARGRARSHGHSVGTGFRLARVAPSRPKRPRWLWGFAEGMKPTAGVREYFQPVARAL